ncbi:MAG: glycosyltransferase family 25 protein [Caulobacteraceae bacterium]|nr:glycosyltransferase family 25 protein [Caulobacteraceae bacterium]
MRAVVINLGRCPDRLERILKLAGEQGVKLEVITAIDGQDPSNKALLEKHRSILVNDRIISDGDMACALSHRKVWRNLLDSDDSWMAVFEDDVHFGSNLSELLDEAWIPPGVELIKLEGRANQPRIGSTPLAAIGGRRLHRLGSSYLGTAGYLISRRAALRSLAYTEKMDVPVDSIMFGAGRSMMSRHAVHQLVPAACIQEIVLAAIEAREDELPTSIIRPTVGKRPFHKSLLRRLKRQMNKIIDAVSKPRNTNEAMGAPQSIPFR